MTSTTSLIDRIPPQALVVVSRALQALAAPIVALLVATSEGLSGQINDAISFCNLLFVGNLCASFVVLAAFGPRRIRNELSSLGSRLYLELIVFAALSALLSSLIFAAIESTTVTNIILLARLGPVLFVIGSAVFVGQAIGKAEGVGFGLIGLGVLAVVFTGSGFTVAKGDLLILASAVVYAVVTMMSKRLLPATGLAALVFVRNFLSAILFFVIAVILFGFDHFAHAFYGPLWGIMLVYALVIIVIGQFAWYKGISLLTPASVARWTVMTPVLAVGYAYVINGEHPSLTQLAALGFIMLGIIVSNIGKFTPRGTSDNAESSVAAS